MLPIRIKVITYPYRRVINDDNFRSIVTEIASASADRITTGKESTPKKYLGHSLALVMLDATAPISQPSEETVMFTIAIGEIAKEERQKERNRLLVEAAAKACQARDLTLKVGHVPSSRKHLLRSGSTRLTLTSNGEYSFYSGCSGQSDAVNQEESSSSEEILEDIIHTWFERWEDEYPDDRWYGGNPDSRFKQVIDVPGELILMDTDGIETVIPR